MDRTKIRTFAKSAFKTIRFFIISSIVLTLMEIGVGYWLLSSRWQLFITHPEMKEFAAELSEPAPLPPNFLRVYTSIFPKHVNASISEMIFFNYGYRLIFRDPDFDSKPHCFCDLVYDIQSIRNPKLKNIVWGGRLKDLEYGFGLEKYTTPEKCFTYFMQEQIRFIKVRTDPATFPALATKEIKDMNDDELIELILLLQSTEKFNRFDDPESFSRRFAEYKVKVEKARNKTAVK